MVKIVIPIYKTELNVYERYALTQCFRILGRYPIVFVKPESLDLSPITEKLTYSFDVENFPDYYFESLQSYNHLMLSPDFYKRFLDVKYILIHQTDALIFRDELEDWCAKGYDYVGAPWIPKAKYLKGYNRFIWYLRVFVSYLASWSPRSIQRDYKVGNGGLSLRNTHKLYTLANMMKSEIAYYKERSSQVAFNEDVFWGIEVNKRQPEQLHIPSYKEALSFSIERFPDASYILNDQQLPFGTHAWYKPPYDQFWKQFIPFDQLR